MPPRLLNNGDVMVDYGDTRLYGHCIFFYFEVCQVFLLTGANTDATFARYSGVSSSFGISETA